MNLKKFSFFAALIFIAISLFTFTTQIMGSKLNKAVGRTNIVITADSTYLFSFPNSANDSLVILSIPGDAYVTVPFGYGEYQLQKLGSLAQLEQKQELVGQTVADLLGVYVNGYVDLGSLKLTGDEILASSKNLRFLLTLLRGDVMTDLNQIDRIQLLRLVLTGNPLTTTVYDLEAAPLVFANRELPDGMQVKQISENALDNFLANKFELAGMRQDNLSIRVANTTDTPLVGQKFARYLSHFGGKVVTVDNSSRAVAGCRVEYLASAGRSILLKYLKNYFNCELSLSVEDGEGIEVTVYLGSDFVGRWK